MLLLSNLVFCPRVLFLVTPLPEDIPLNLELLELFELSLKSLNFFISKGLSIDFCVLIFYLLKVLLNKSSYEPPYLIKLVSFITYLRVLGFKVLS